MLLRPRCNIDGSSGARGRERQIAGCGKAAQSSPRKQAGARRAISADQYISFPRTGIGGGYDQPAVQSRLGGEVCAGAGTMFAQREMLVASGHEHGAQDAHARLAEQYAHAGKRGNTGACFPGGGVGVSPRCLPANILAWSKFHDTILHPLALNPRAAPLRHAPLLFSHLLLASLRGPCGTGSA
jgi:hypothetical protein